MYIVAMQGAFGDWNATSTMIHATYAEAEADMTFRVQRASPRYAGMFRIFDAEHEPGRSIRPNPFGTY